MEYVRYFGGVQQFASAPRLSVSPLKDGVLTVLTKCGDSASFRLAQAAVIAHLGHELFGGVEGAPTIHKQLFWRHLEREGPCASDTSVTRDDTSQSCTRELAANKELEQLILLAVNSAVKSVYESGNLFPTVFVDDGQQVRYFSFEAGELGQLRAVVRETIQTRCSQPIAYAFVYDSTVEEDDEEVDALVVEAGENKARTATEYVVTYDRSTRRHEPWRRVRSVESLLPIL
jgi:hypothetical protein